MNRPTRALPVIALMSFGCVGTIDDAANANGADRPDRTGVGSNPGVVDLGEVTCDEERTRPIPRRVWRLSGEQYARSLRAALGFDGVRGADIPGDGLQSTGFDNDARANFVNDGLARIYFETAQEAAAWAVDQFPATHPCMAEETVDSACLRVFLADVGSAAFRRPLEAHEVDRYATFYLEQATEHGSASAGRMVLEAIFLSPNFLYRTELGDEVGGEAGSEVALTDHEIASQLAYMVTDGPPDAALIEAARRGELHDAAVVEAHARRLLALPEARVKLGRFIDLLLHIDRLESSGTLEPALAAAMLEETRTFVERVVFEEHGNFETLLTAPHSFVGPTMAEHYGLSLDGTETQRVEFGEHRRSGLLSHASVLSAHHGPVHRGLLIRLGLLCTTLPPPPPDATNQLDELHSVPDGTERENYERFARANPVCNSCHETFQPLGLAFETFDELGRYRELDKGQVIDPSGELLAAGDAAGAFADAAELTQRLASSKTAQNCFAARYLTYAYGREATVLEDSCTIFNVGERFRAADTSIEELIVSLTQDPSFYVRRAGE